MLLESCIISLFASVPFSSACSVDSESVKMTIFGIARGFVGSRDSLLDLLLMF